MAFEVNAPAAAKVAKVVIGKPVVTVYGMSVWFTEPWPTAAQGQKLPFVGSAHQSFELLQDFKLCPTAYVCNLAKAAGYLY